MTNREYLAALYSFSFFGPARTKLLLDYFGGAGKAWNAEKSSLTAIGIKPNIIDNFLLYRDKFEKSNYFNRLKKHSINFVTIDEEEYPLNLRDIPYAPTVLYFIGSLNKSFQNAVAIVGSRKMSSYGREVAETFSSQLAALGIVIVSGLALGIDAVAHKACIDADGKGIVVLASGLDTISPFTNRWIALEIIKKGGAIVSEYPLGQPPFRTSFPSRNRIISGLAKAIIVVEGLQKSGTLLTASAAADQGRTVFAIPGQISSPLSKAPHYLIQNGAKLATSVKDVLEELDLQIKLDSTEIDKVMPGDRLEAKIIDVLRSEAMHIDEIGRITRLKIEEVSAKLIVMELKGLVKNIGNGVYKKL